MRWNDPQFEKLLTYEQQLELLDEDVRSVKIRLQYVMLSCGPEGPAFWRVESAYYKRRRALYARYIWPSLRIKLKQARAHIGNTGVHPPNEKKPW